MTWYAMLLSKTKEQSQKFMNDKANTFQVLLK